MATEKIEGSGRRLLLLIEVIVELQTEFSLKELTARAKLPTTTVHRLLQVLLEAGMVDRASGQSYRRGIKLLRMASMLKDVDPAGVGQPFLRHLWNEWQETAVLALYRSHTRTGTVVDTIPAPHPLRYVMERYTELSLPWGSIGRAMLAYLPTHEVDAVIAAKPKSPLTGRPFPPVEDLLAILAEVRREGVAVYIDLTFDIAGVAAPVFGADRSVIGSIGLAIPASRFVNYEQDRISKAVAASARGLSEAIGWAPARSDRRPNP